MDRDDIIGNLVEQDTGLDIYTDRAQSPAVNVVSSSLFSHFVALSCSPRLLHVLIKNQYQRRSPGIFRVLYDTSKLKSVQRLGMFGLAECEKMAM